MSDPTRNPARSPTTNTNTDQTEVARQRQGRTNAIYFNGLELADPENKQKNTPKQLVSNQFRLNTLNGRLTQINLTLQQQLAADNYPQFKIQRLPSLYPPETFYRDLLPNDLLNLRLWFDGNDPNGNGILPAVNSAVNSWTDKSGRGINLTGGTSLNTFSSYGGRNSVLFNVDLLKNTSANINVNTITFFIVWLQKEPKSNAAMFFLSDAAAAYVGTGIGVYSDSTSTRPGGVSVLRVHPYQIGSEINVNLPAATASDVVPFNISCITIDSTSSVQAFINGNSSGTKTNAVSRNTVVNNCGMGSENINFNYAGSISNISEILLYNSLLSTTDRQSVEGYLAWKWNLQGSLPSNHPYRGQKPKVPLPQT